MSVSVSVHKIAGEDEVHEGQREAPLYKLCVAAQDEIKAAHEKNPAVAEGVVRLMAATAVYLDAIPTIVAIDQLASLVVTVAQNAENRSSERGDVYPSFPTQQFLDVIIDELPRRLAAQIAQQKAQEAARKEQFAQFAKMFNLDPETGQPLSEDQINAANEANQAAAAGQLPN